MSEKVYGICETNKCRKEVIPKDNIAIRTFTGTVHYDPNTKRYYSVGSASFPTGFNADNSILIGYKINNEYTSCGEEVTGDRNESNCTIRLKHNGFISYTFNTTEKITDGDIQVTFVLLKIS